MESENELKLFKGRVSELRRLKNSKNAEMFDDEMFDKFETVQNMLEAALIEGAELKTFVHQMLDITSSSSLSELALNYGRQDEAQLFEEFN